MSEPAKEAGLFASLRRLLGTALEIAQVRLDLLATEVELEKRRLFDGLLWGAIALVVLGIGLVMLCGFFILLFRDGYRLAAVGVLAILLLGASILLLRESRRRLQTPKGLFTASLTELEQDRSDLQEPGQHDAR